MTLLSTSCIVLSVGICVPLAKQQQFQQKNPIEEKFVVDNMYCFVFDFCCLYNVLFCPLVSVCVINVHVMNACVRNVCVVYVYDFCCL